MDQQDAYAIARWLKEASWGKVLDEMYFNRIYDPARILELRNQVVRALQALREKTMANHAALLDESARGAAGLSLGGRDGDEIADGYARVIRAMEAMLARMHKVEGFTEIVETVRSILKQQGDVEEKTRKKYEDVLRDIFGDSPPPKDGDDGR